MTAFLDHSSLALLRRAVDSFRRGRVPYMLIGAWALAVWGRPRATQDLDFLVMVNEDELSSLGAHMTRAGMVLDKTWLKWNPLLRGSQLRLQFHGFTIDLLRPRDPHDQQAFRRCRKKRLAGRYFWVVSPEDFILQKLKVGRPRDFEDAASVVERSRKELDREYLEHWARQLRVIEELGYIFAS